MHDCLTDPDDCVLDARWGHCTLSPIITGIDNARLLFQRALFLRGAYDLDCDPGHYNVSDNRTDVRRMTWSSH